MGNLHLFWASKCGKTDRAPSLNSKRKTAQNRMVEPQIYGVPEKSKTFWGEEERRRERADDFLKRKSRRERYIVRDDFGRGRRDRSCFATPLAVPGEKLPWSVVFLPTAAPLSPRCICHRQRSPITPGTLRVPRVHFLHIQKTANTAKAVLAVLAGAEGIEPSALGFGDRCSTS